MEWKVSYFSFILIAKMLPCMHKIPPPPNHLKMSRGYLDTSPLKYSLCFFSKEIIIPHKHNDFVFSGFLAPMILTQ